MHAAAGSAAVAVLSEDRKRCKCSQRHHTQEKFNFHGTSLVVTSRTKHLADIHPQIEGKAAQVKSHAAGVAQLKPQDRSRLKGHPRVEAVFTGKIVAAGDGVFVK